MKPNIQEGWMVYGSGSDRTMILYTEGEPVNHAIRQKVIYITDYPIHFTPDLFKALLDNNHEKIELVKRIKHLEQDLALERMKYKEAVKNVDLLQEVFQKHLMNTDSGMAALLWGKDVIKVAAEMLRKIFMVHTFTSEFPLQVQCKCKNKFFLPNYKQILLEHFADQMFIPAGQDKPFPYSHKELHDMKEEAIKEWEQEQEMKKEIKGEFHCQIIEVECSCGHVTSCIPILFPFESKCINCNTDFTITEEIYKEYKGKRFKTFVEQEAAKGKPSKPEPTTPKNNMFNLAKEFPNGILMHCDCGKGTTIYPAWLPWEYECFWCNKKGKMDWYQYNRLLEISQKKKQPVPEPTIPAEARDLHVFAIKDSESSPTGKEAFIGFTIENGNFCFVQVPFEEKKTNPAELKVIISCLNCGNEDGIFIDKISYPYHCRNCNCTIFKINTIKQFLNHHT